MKQRETDVLVIGGGGAGLTAALTAARLGRDVVLIEKNAGLGGTTALSVGSISSSSTPQQKLAGICDSPDEHFEDMGKFVGDLEPRDNLELRRIFVEAVPEAFRFLMDLGMEFMGPVPEPPHRHARLHNIVPHSGSYIHQLSKHCRGEGVELLTSCPAEDLLDEGGRVAGVRLSNSAIIRARHGVVIATGDFSSATKDYKRRFLPPTVSHVEGINKNCTGDGHRMAEKIGAEVINGDLAWGPELRFVAPPKPSFVTRIPPIRPFAKLVNWSIRNMSKRLLRPFLMSFVTTYLAPSHELYKEGAILVNKEGRRFCDELDRPAFRVADQPGKIAYILMDGAIAKKFGAWPHFVSTAPGVAYAYLRDYERNRKDICCRADNLRALATRIGVPEDTLAETVAHCNEDQTIGGRPMVAEPPFYALGPLKAWTVFTEGGLRVNRNLEVVRADGTAIRGLFAAGSAGQGGLLLEGHGHHLGWAISSGRLAGRNVAFAPRQSPNNS